MTNTNERPAEEGEEWEKEIDELAEKRCFFGEVPKGMHVCVLELPDIKKFIRTLLPRTRKEAEEKGRSAALDEAIEALKTKGKSEYLRRWGHTKVGEEIEKRNGYCESLDDSIATLNALKGKGLNAKE